MVATAASGTAIDGEVWIAGPDALTGLSSAPKLAHLDSDPSPFGMRHAEVSGLLRYETPPFEMLALRRNGILNVPPTWRTGRLYRGARLDKLPITAAAPAEGWVEHGTERARIWSRPRPSGTKFEVTESLGLSRLDPERAQAALWTSGHRYSVGPPDLATGSCEDALREMCAIEVAVLDGVVAWRGSYGVQKNETAFHSDQR